MPYLVQNLIEGQGEPTTVHPDDSAQKALALMIEHGFSQLPVIDEAKRPLGMVTHESILRALSNFGVKLEDLRVSNAIVRAQTYRPEDDLFDLLDRLKETNAVLIVDGVDKLIGMGARIVLCDPHRCLVQGPSRLHAESQGISSPDIRAGMALLIAALCAKGTSRIRNIGQIDRGYERVGEKLQALGARIERVEA